MMNLKISESSLTLSMLKVQGVRFGFDDHKFILKGVSCKVKPGEIVSIVGPTGAGKSTLLHCIAGLYNIDEGKIYLDGQKILGPKENLIPGHPDIKHVAQDFNLLPNHTAEENIWAELHQYFKYEKQEIATTVLKEFNILTLRNKLPRMLSGGQQQRIALAKAIAERPKLLLLDEPFNQQDSWNKEEVLIAIHNLAKELNIGVIMVTHQYEDALHLSDEIWVMQKGKLKQKGTPKEIFFEPKSESIASLFGEFLIINNKIVRPISLVKRDTGKIEASVIESRFKGNRYEYLMSYKDQKFSMVGSKSVKPGTTMRLALKK